MLDILVVLVVVVLGQRDYLSDSLAFPTNLLDGDQDDEDDEDGKEDASCVKSDREQVVPVVVLSLLRLHLLLAFDRAIHFGEGDRTCLQIFVTI